MSGLTGQLDDFIARPGALDLDARVLGIVRTGFIDTVGVMLAGRDEPVTAIVRRFVNAGHCAAADADVIASIRSRGVNDAARQHHGA